MAKSLCCCSWETFQEGFFATWAYEQAPSSLIDWKLAKRHWQRYAMTGFEAAQTQLQALRKESEYLLWGRDPDQNGDGGRGGPTPSPKAPSPLPAQA